MINQNIQDFKTSVKGKFFKAIFVKKDGTLREMICRFGVKKHLKGGELSYDAEASNNLIVFDVRKKAYRTVNLDNLITLKCGEKEVVGNYALRHELS